ncbi:cytoplasm protein [Moniliophthora roreri]|uniref:Golgi apparatus membrane protein TVP38 n=1 Tax=Moniliophthora roreri TaxID=221103 RepID=A0A0W0FIU7_MONRR|nr:cytoplasm protein [Moniliophthora roreri]
MDSSPRYPNSQPFDTLNTYPPPNFSSSSKPSTPAGYQTANVNLTLNERNNLARTPSPTPSELKEMKSGAIDWRGMTNWRFWIRREWLWYYVALVIILVVTALVTIYHDQIVDALKPAAQWLQRTSWGWVVPILVLFVISFPPLFGHEIVAILCGLVWGLWIGFGIVAAGTFLGEVGNFYAFKYCCSARGEKLEKTKISYACLAKVVRDGGFRIALIARLSAIPGHFTTAVFSTCGMGIIVFSLAAILSMPKQFITVYLGVLLEQSADDPNQPQGSGGQTTDTSDHKKDQLISKIVLAITFLITVAAMWYILRQMNKVKPEVIYARRKARQVKLMRNTLYGNDSTVFNPNESETDIPLAAPGLGNDNVRSLSFDQRGDIVAPQPQRVVSTTNMYGYTKSEEDLESAESSSEHQHRNYANGYAYSQTRQSTDDVTWDTGAYANQRRPSYPPGISPPPHRNYATSSEPVVQGNRSDQPYAMTTQQQARNPSHPIPRPLQFPQPQSSPPRAVQTPTQVQYASPTSPHSNLASPALPTPNFPSQSQPTSSPLPQLHSYPQHAVEPTDMTFHTAMGSVSEYDHGDRGPSVAEAYGAQGRLGQRSSPPPSYTTNVR